MKHYDNIKKLRLSARAWAFIVIGLVLAIASIAGSLIYLTAKLVESVL